MSLRNQIDTLRQQFRAGDESARGALKQLLQAYLLLIARRTARSPNAGSRAAGGIRRLVGRTHPAGKHGHLPLRIDADDLCRRMCDELLKPRDVNPPSDRAIETLRTFGRSTACFTKRN